MHKAAFQALLDYLIILRFGRDSMLHREKAFCPTVVFIFDTKSASTLVFEFVAWQPGALFPLEVLSGSVFTAAGESTVYSGIGFKQWGRFHELYSVVSLALGNHSEFQAVNCGRYTKSFFGTLGLGVARWRGRWCAFVHVSGLSFVFFCFFLQFDKLYF